MIELPLVSFPSDSTQQSSDPMPRLVVSLKLHFYRNWKHRHQQMYRCRIGPPILQSLVETHLRGNWQVPPNGNLHRIHRRLLEVVP